MLRERGFLEVVLEDYRPIADWSNVRIWVISRHRGVSEEGPRLQAPILVK